jgi:fructose-bisphosphate aldolase class II
VHITPPQTYLAKARREGWAMPHFNFSTFETLRAIVETAAKLQSPVFVATSEGERKFFGVNAAVAAVQVMRDEYHIPIYLNADHTKSWEASQEAVDAGYDAVLIDASHLPFAQNTELTKKVVEYAKVKNPGIIIEGELGHLKGESKIQQRVEVKKEDLTNPEEAQAFIKTTGIDMLASAVGNVHGIVLEGEEKLAIDLIKKIKDAVGDASLVLHGASGLSQEDIVGAIKAGINVVHINTELRVAYTQGLKKFLTLNPEEVVPYKFLTAAVQAVSAVVEEKIKLFGAADKI